MNDGKRQITNLFKGENISRQVSRVVIGKYDRRQVLEVDGRPFFYNGVQIRVDKIKDIYHYTDDQFQTLFQIAKDDGFTVAGSQIRWMDIQPDLAVPAAGAASMTGGIYGDPCFTGDTIRTGYDASSPAEQSLAYIQFDFPPYRYIRLRVQSFVSMSIRN